MVESACHPCSNTPGSAEFTQRGEKSTSAGPHEPALPPSHHAQLLFIYYKVTADNGVLNILKYTKSLSGANMITEVLGLP